ncbi:MAG: 4Fe-4S binding protein [Candidatus Heimdallarchaeota archaeon]|nr:4Fe-4S binding protein [Candidatus Heimdallarchaeota archaeon]
MEIQPEKCYVCFGCATVCPADAVPATERGVVIDQIKCTKCGNCLKVCPMGAILE